MISVRAPRLFGPGLEMKKVALNKLECLCGQPEQMAEGAGIASNTDPMFSMRSPKIKKDRPLYIGMERGQHVCQI